MQRKLRGANDENQTKQNTRLEKNLKIYLTSTFHEMPCKQIRATNNTHQKFATNK